MRLLNQSFRRYQSIDVDDTAQTPSSHHKSAGRHRRCIRVKCNSFSWGVLVGLALVPLYDVMNFAVRNRNFDAVERDGKERIHHPLGPRHSHPLQSLLHGHHYTKVSIGPRPYFLINEMADDVPEGERDPNRAVTGTFERRGLKEKLQKCANTIKEFKPSDFVFGHRGAALQFPEHSDRSHDAASRMGAGVVECDVNWTKDKQLICRHARCDLHLTTDVLLIPHLAAKCTRPFRPAVGKIPAYAKCCTTDFTLEEIQGEMCSRMSSSNNYAKTAHQYISSTPSFRTDLYSHDCPHIQSHRDFIQVVDTNGGSFIPEFKMLDYNFGAEGYTRRMFIEQVLKDYESINPYRVYPQGFEWEDLYYVVNNTDFGMNTIALDKNLDAIEYDRDQLREYLKPLADNGVTTVAPTLSMLLDVENGSDVVPSLYAEVAYELGLDIIAWSFERSDALSNSQSSWYYKKLSGMLHADSDMIKVLDVLYEDVGVVAVYTDFPSVVTFYANCKGIALH